MTDPVTPAPLDPNANSGGNGGTDVKPQDLFKLLETYPQEEKDKVFSARAKQARESALSDLFKSVGVENADALKAIIAKAKEADEAQKSELQKAQDKALAAEKAATEQKAAYESQITDLEKHLTDTEIKIAASKAIKDKDGNVIRQAFRADALDDVVVLINRKEIKRENGTVSGVEDALAELAKAKIFLLEETQSPVKSSPTDNSLRKPNKPKSNVEDDEKPFFKSL